MKKKLLIILIIVVVAAFFGYKYVYKSHRDIATEEAVYTVTVPELFAEFQKNDSLANAKYLDKTVEVHGKISNIDMQNKIITVDEKLSARFTKGIQAGLQPQSSITLKGRIVGFDDLLEEIQFDQCTIENKN